MRANITILLFCVPFFLSFCTNLQPIFLGKTIWNKECPKSCSWSWEAPSLAQVGKFHKMLIACPWRPLVGFILSVFGMAFGLTRLTRVQPNSNSISQMSLINCSNCSTVVPAMWNAWQKKEGRRSFVITNSELYVPVIFIVPVPWSKGSSWYWWSP